MPELIGFIIDMIIGEPLNPFHPVRIIGYIAKKLETFIRNLIKNHLKIAGAITWTIVILITFTTTYFITNFFYTINSYFGVIVEGILIYFCISAKGLKTESLKVIKYLIQKDIIKARKSLSYIVGRDTDNLDVNQILKAVIETIAENMSDGVIAPLIFAFIGGAPLAMTYKAINTCDSMFGYKNDKYINFGFTSAVIDDIFNYIPARVTAYLIIITSFIAKYDYKNSYKIYKRDKYKHKSLNSAHPEAAMAGALNVCLGGANYYFGNIVKKPKIGDETKKIEINDVYEANRILIYTSTIGFLIMMISKYCIWRLI